MSPRHTTSSCFHHRLASGKTHSWQGLSKLKHTLHPQANISVAPDSSNQAKLLENQSQHVQRGYSKRGWTFQCLYWQKAWVFSPHILKRTLYRPIFLEKNIYGSQASFQLRKFEDPFPWRWWLCEAAVWLVWNKSVKYRSACCPEFGWAIQICTQTSSLGWISLCVMVVLQAKSSEDWSNSASDEEESFPTSCGILDLWHQCRYLFHVK